MINFKNIYFSYNGNNAIFSNFSYNLKVGDIVTIIGNSGCGKTTLLNLINGLLTPQKGAISINNNAYLTQELIFSSYRTAFENALFACELRNNLTETKIDQAHKLFQKFNLSESSKTKFPQELSGGMQQRVALIQTLLIDAELYLLDEPFKAIDRTTNLAIQELIWNWFKTNNFSSIIVTHNPEEAVLLSDKVLILSAEKENQEIIFEKEFSKLNPLERLNTEFYNQYMLEIFEKQKYS